MKNILLAMFVAFVTLSSASVEAQTDVKTTPPINVLMETSMGNIELELYPDKAPVTVANFVKYVDDKFYDNLIFHRVINNFMIQGGGFGEQMLEKRGGYPAIQIESDNGLKNTRGTIAMARTSNPNSATSQFFINHKDNSFLNFTAPTQAGYGYAVFGKVTKGMDIVDKIAVVKTTKRNGHGDVPVEPIYIKSVKIVK